MFYNFLYINCECNLHYEKFADGSVKCIEDEIPFEIPKSWAWCRVNTICYINPKNSVDDNLQVSFIPMTLISDSYANYHSQEIKVWSQIKKGFTHFSENDIGIAKITPCFENRKSVIFKNLKNGLGAGTTELFVLRPVNNIIIEYIFWNIKTNRFIQGGVQTYTGDVGQQRIQKNYISKYLIPLPPTKEQQRIVEIVKNLLLKIKFIESNCKGMFDSISSLKSKILDLAIRGKLAPQDPNDEPADVLLERIRKEKEELIKQGKIKRDKKESIIFKGDDNSYYDNIPDNWSLTTLKEITNDKELNDGDWIVSDNMVDSGPVKLIQLGSIGFMNYIEKGFKYLTRDTFERLNCSTIKENYLLINRIVSDKMCCCMLPKINGTLITTVDTCWIAPNDNHYNIKYLMFALSSPLFQSEVNCKSSGTTRRRISKLNLIDIQFPFPPILEQKKIVDEVEKLFKFIDNIASALK